MANLFPPGDEENRLPPPMTSRWGRPNVMVSVEHLARERNCRTSVMERFLQEVGIPVMEMPEGRMVLAWSLEATLFAMGTPGGPGTSGFASRRGPLGGYWDALTKDPEKLHSLMEAVGGLYDALSQAELLGALRDHLAVLYKRVKTEYRRQDQHLPKEQRISDR